MTLRIPLISDAWNRLGQALQNDLEGIKSEARQLDAFSKQSDSLPAKLALKATGLAYAAATLPQRMTAPLAYGVVDFPAAVILDPVAAAQSIPASVDHNGSAMHSGGIDIYNGNISAGLVNFSDGFWGDFILCAPLAKGMTTLGVFKKTIPVAETPFARQLASAAQMRAESALQKAMAADGAAFNTWMAAPERGAIEIPSWMLPGMTKENFAQVFRQGSVTEADLLAMVQHTDAKVSGAARQVLAERLPKQSLPPTPGVLDGWWIGIKQRLQAQPTLKVPEAIHRALAELLSPTPEGYRRIPGGVYKGQTLSPFAMKATPVTNGEWFQGVDGKTRYVILYEDPQTLAMSLEDVTTHRPSSIKPSIFHPGHGDLVIQGALILVKLEPNPSALVFTLNLKDQVFTAVDQPVVGVNYYQSQAWTLMQPQTSGRLTLPTELQWRAVASNYGNQKYGTATGNLVENHRYTVPFNRPFNSNTEVVDHPNYLPGPFGVHSTGNIWRLIQADPTHLNRVSHARGIKCGGSWIHHLDWNMAADRSEQWLAPFERGYDTGFSPVIVDIPK